MSCDSKELDKMIDFAKSKLNKPIINKSEIEKFKDLAFCQIWVPQNRGKSTDKIEFKAPKFIFPTNKTL